MKFDNKAILLEDGRTCLLRPAHPDDSEQLLEYLKITAAETPFVLRYPDEVTYTLENEREILAQSLENETSAMIVADVDGNIAGNCALSGLGNKRRILHRCSLGIALKKEYWNLGIGTELITYATELAKQIGYEQIELEVVAENERAIHLYQKCGFYEIGKRPHAFKYDDGLYRDELIMNKFI